jgi:hypothetical protein
MLTDETDNPYHASITRDLQFTNQQRIKFLDLPLMTILGKAPESNVVYQKVDEFKGCLGKMLTFTRYGDFIYDLT